MFIASFYDRNDTYLGNIQLLGLHIQEHMNASGDATFSVSSALQSPMNTVFTEQPLILYDVISLWRRVKILYRSATNIDNLLFEGWIVNVSYGVMETKVQCTSLMGFMNRKIILQNIALTAPLDTVIGDIWSSIETRHPSHIIASIGTGISNSFTVDIKFGEMMSKVLERAIEDGYEIQYRHPYFYIDTVLGTDHTINGNHLIYASQSPYSSNIESLEVVQIYGDKMANSYLATADITFYFEGSSVPYDVDEVSIKGTYSENDAITLQQKALNYLQKRAYGEVEYTVSIAKNVLPGVFRAGDIVRLKHSNGFSKMNIDEILRVITVSYEASDNGFSIKLTLSKAPFEKRGLDEIRKKLG